MVGTTSPDLTAEADRDVVATDPVDLGRQLTRP
jgi:hypothetical protein